MDVKVVLEMFKQIRQDLMEFKKEKGDKINQIDGVILQQTIDSDEVAKLKKEVDHYKKSNETMTSAMKNMAAKLVKLESRVSDL